MHRYFRSNASRGRSRNVILTDLDDLFAPLERLDRFVIGQLGQSLDGRIATVSGHSHYINGPEDIERLHRLRALVDAVVVGAGTVEADDPRLTVRHVEGPNPVRVALDPRGRLHPARAIFTDGAAPTLWIQSEAADRLDSEGKARDPHAAEHVQIVVLPAPANTFDPADVLAELDARGLRRVLVEGGGRTVSSFLEADLLDRLHVSVASLLIGSGRPGITLPQIESLEQARRPAVRHVLLGSDLLFDLDLRSEGA